jgi:hypothetical protein
MMNCSNGPVATVMRPIETPLKGVVNGRERSFPLSRVHPERFRDLCAAADLIGRSGGMNAAAVDVTTSLVQIAFRGFEDSERASCRGREVAGHLLRVGLNAAPQTPSTGSRLALEVRAYGPQLVLVSVYVECAEGFGIVEPAARAIAPEVARLLGAPAPPTFSIGAAEHRRVRVQGQLSLAALCEDLGQGLVGRAPRERLEPARLREVLPQVLARHAHAQLTPDLAFEHNARVLSGLAAASMIFGAATDFLQAEGQTHAARWGSCEPLVRWEPSGAELAATLEVPVALQRVRGVLNAREIEAACSVADIDCARSLELACASVGLVASASGLYADLRAAAATHTSGASRPSRMRAGSQRHYAA